MAATSVMEVKANPAHTHLADELFRRVFDQGPLGMAIVGKTFRFEKVNQTLCAMLGYKESELQRLTFPDVTHPEDVDSDVALASKLFAGEIESYQIQKRYVRKDGTIIWINLTGSLIKDPHGNPLYGLAMIEDINEKKHAELKLTRSEALLKMAQHMAKLGWWRVKNGDAVVHWSDETYRIHDMAIGEPINVQKALEFFPLASRKTITEAFQACRDQGIPYDLELPMQTAKGRAIWVRALGQPEHDAGQIISVFGTFQDITDRKTFELELKEGSQRLEMALAAADTGMWDWYLPTGYVRFDERWARMFGYTLAEIEPNVRSWEKLVHPDDMPDVIHALDRHITGETDFYESIHRCRHKDGSWVWILDRGKILERDSHGKPVRAIGTHVNITELKEYQAQLKEAHDALDRTNRELVHSIENARQLATKAKESEHTKSEFLAVMSHEIRTPLNAIIGMSELITQTALSPEQRDYAETITSSGQTLLRLINDVLDYSKLQASSVTLEEAPVNLIDLLTETLSLTEDKAEAKGLRQYFLLGRNPHAWARTDPYRLKQIVLNLVSNAVKFTETGHICVSLHNLGRAGDKTRIAIRVKDTGIGIRKEDQQRIFDPFTQAEASIARRYGGTGLGLVIARKIAEKMGGHIHVRSQPGRGAVFTCEVLVEELPSPTPCEEKPAIFAISPRRLFRQSVKAAAFGFGAKCAVYKEWGSFGQETDLVGQNVVLVDVSALPMLPHCATLPDQAALYLVGPLESSAKADWVTKGSFRGQLSEPLRSSALERVCHDLRQAKAGQPVSTATAAQSAEPLSPENSWWIPDAPKVLLAEDNVTNQKLMAMVLKKIGCHFDMVNDGQEAVRLWEQNGDYGLILMDIQMPVMDGVEATRLIREAEKKRQISSPVPIYALTADVSTEVRSNATDAGMNGHLLKPLQIEKLRAVIQSSRT